MFKKLTIKDITRISLLTALICISSYIKIELPSVPVTAQTLAVMLAGCILTPRQAAFSLLTFLLLGAVGAPVFSGGTSGLPIIFGSTGGYLIGFWAGAIVISLLKGKGDSVIRMLAANIAGGVIIVYALGTPWLSYSTGMGIAKAFTVGALYFIPFDLMKAVIAAFIAKRINKQLSNSSNYNM